MLPSNYRVDKQTGAVIFKKSAGRQKAQQIEHKIKELTKKVEILENQNILLFELLLENKVLTNNQVKELLDLQKPTL